MLEPMKRETAKTETPARSAKGRVGVAQVVKVTEWLDAGRDLGGFPVAAAEAAEVALPVRLRIDGSALTREEPKPTRIIRTLSAR
jgi:hypothetical protein